MSTAATADPVTMADPAIVKGVLNRALQWFSNVGETFDSQLLRMNAGDQFLVDSVRHGANLMSVSTMAVIIQALLGSDPTLAATILAQRAAGAQPQSGGGPGQPVSFPIQQPLPSPADPNVYVLNPTTGALTRAA